MLTLFPLFPQGFSKGLTRPAEEYEAETRQKCDYSPETKPEATRQKRDRNVIIPQKRSRRQKRDYSPETKPEASQTSSNEAETRQKYDR